MNVAAQALHRQQQFNLGLVDLDIHPRVKAITDLKPYMASRWWEYLQTYGIRRRHGFAKGHPYPKMQPGDGMRRDSWPPNGLMPGADLDFMRAQRALVMPVAPGPIAARRCESAQRQRR